MDKGVKATTLAPWSVPRSLRKKCYNETSLAKSRQIAGGATPKNRCTERYVSDLMFG